MSDSRTARGKEALIIVVGTIMASQDSHILIPRTCEYIMLHGKRYFADVIKKLEMMRISS